MIRYIIPSINKVARKVAVLALLLAISFLLTTCSNMRWGVNAGVDVRFGPNGPQVVPTVSVDAYSGGRW